MLEKELKDSVLCNLRLGVIQPFQIASTLHMKGVSSFDVKRLSEEIAEAYRKEHPCY